VDLGAYYDLSVSGQYSVQYNVSAPNLHSEKAGAVQRVATLRSNALGMSLEGRPNVEAGRVITPDAVTGSTAFTSCSSAQQADLIAARSQASTYAANASAYLNAGTQGSRFTTWFGVYNLTRYNTVKSHFAAILSAMDTQSVTFNCKCKKTNTYAYVYANQPYTIYLCGAFWAAPMAGTDSKGGTLIHEMSHFTVVAGTNDYAYGQTNAKALAISNPTNAVANADNHEYFAENTPALP
jgi:peptidyl-Lys metalloendopeptidase